MTAWAILTDVTLCTGCESCVSACQHGNGLDPEARWSWQDDPFGLSSTRWTTMARAAHRSVRVHCRHCLEPACASACPVGALARTETGAVAYRADLCMGCRYCMIACPFAMTRYEWESALPRVRKCILCHDRIASGEISEPECTAACPTKATVFGEREALLAEAWRRIRENPSRYIPRVWGEHEVGGTSVLYISDVDLETAGWPGSLAHRSYPELTAPAMHAVPPTFVGMGAAMFGLSWVIGRRNRRAGETAAAPREDETR